MFRVALRLAHHWDPMAADLTLQWTYYLYGNDYGGFTVMARESFTRQQEHTGCFCAVQTSQLLAKTSWPNFAPTEGTLKY